MADHPKDKPADKNKDQEVDLFSLPNQVITFAPAPAKIERLVKLLQGDRNIAVHQVATSEEMVQITKQQAPCLLLVSASSKEEILKATNALSGVRDLASKQMFKGIAISKIDDGRLQKAFAFLGCNEFILESIPDHTVYFKISLQLKSLRMRRSQVEKEAAKKKRQDGQAEGGDKRGGPSSVIYREALELGHDTWLLNGFKSKKVGLNWIIDLEGPDPFSGEWRSVGGSGNPKWFWKARDEYGNETKSNSDATGWSFSGNRPLWDNKSFKWKFVSKEPQLFFKVNGQLQASKVETKDGIVSIAADSDQATTNIDLSKVIGAKVRAARQADPSQSAESQERPSTEASSTAPEVWSEESDTYDDESKHVSEETPAEYVPVDNPSFDGTEEIETFDSEMTSAPRSASQSSEQVFDDFSTVTENSTAGNLLDEARVVSEELEFDAEQRQQKTKQVETEDDERAELAALQKRHYEGLPLSATEKKRLATLKRKFAPKDNAPESQASPRSSKPENFAYDLGPGSEVSNETGEFNPMESQWTPEEPEFNNLLKPEEKKPESNAADYIVEQESRSEINNLLTEEPPPPPFVAHQALAQKRRKEARAKSYSATEYAEIEAKAFDTELGVWSHVEGFGFVYITPRICSLRINELRSHEVFWVMRNSSNEGPYYKSSRESWLFDRGAPMPENIPGFALLDHRVQKYLEVMTGEMLSNKDAQGRIRLALAKEEARSYELEQAGILLEPSPDLAPAVVEAKSKSQHKLKARLAERKARRQSLTEEQRQSSISLQQSVPPAGRFHVGYLPFQLTLSERMMRKDGREQLFPWICEEVARECNATRVAILKMKAEGNKELDVLGSSFEKEINRVDTSFLLASMHCIEQSFQTGIKTFDSSSRGTSIVYPIKKADEVLALIWLELSVERGPFTEQDEQFIVEVVLVVLSKYFTDQQPVAMAA